MTKTKGKLFIAFLVIIGIFAFYACDDGDDNNNSNRTTGGVNTTTTNGNNTTTTTNGNNGNTTTTTTSGNFTLTLRNNNSPMGHLNVTSNGSSRSTLVGGVSTESTSMTISSGSQVIITPTNFADHRFETWSGTNLPFTNVTHVGSISFEMPPRNLEITGNFKEDLTGCANLVITRNDLVFNPIVRRISGASTNSLLQISQSLDFELRNDGNFNASGVTANWKDNSGNYFQFSREGDVNSSLAPFPPAKQDVWIGLNQGQLFGEAGMFHGEIDLEWRCDPSAGCSINHKKTLDVFLTVYRREGDPVTVDNRPGVIYHYNAAGFRGEWDRVLYHHLVASTANITNAMDKLAGEP